MSASQTVDKRMAGVEDYGKEHTTEINDTKATNEIGAEAKGDVADTTHASMGSFYSPDRTGMDHGTPKPTDNADSDKPEERNRVFAQLEKLWYSPEKALVAAPPEKFEAMLLMLHTVNQAVIQYTARFDTDRPDGLEGLEDAVIAYVNHRELTEIRQILLVPDTLIGIAGDSDAEKSMSPKIDAELLSEIRDQARRETEEMRSRLQNSLGSDKSIMRKDWAAKVNDRLRSLSDYLDAVSTFTGMMRALDTLRATAAPVLFCTRHPDYCEEDEHLMRFATHIQTFVNDAKNEMSPAPRPVIENLLKLQHRGGTLQ